MSMPYGDDAQARDEAVPRPSRRSAALDWPALSCLKPTTAQARELQLFLHRLLAEHLDRIPANRTSALGLE